MSRGSGDDVLKIGSFQYLHVLDTNLNTVRVEIGPKTFTRLEHEKGAFSAALSIQNGPSLASYARYFIFTSSKELKLL